jgi:hypothetical protein
MSSDACRYPGRPSELSHMGGNSGFSTTVEMYLGIKEF